MKAVVILNQASGSTRQRQADWLQQLERTFEHYGVPAEIHAVDSTNINALVQTAIAQQSGVVVAGGGDGTINSVASVLIDTRIPLGILPLGTFNHFAKDLNIPLKLEEAVRTIAEGSTRDIDVGEVNGHIFLNNSSIGAYPLAIKERDEQRKQRGRRKTVAMIIAILRVLRIRPLFRVRLTIDGETFVCQTPFVFIGNNEYAGNLITESNRSCLEGGKLCVFTATCTGFLCLVRFLFASLFNRLEQSKDFSLRSGTEVRVEPHKKLVRVARDGEVFKLRSPLLFRVRPRALRVIVPATQKQ